MRTQLDDLQHDAVQISRQLDSMRESASYAVGVAETQHREVMDYLLTMKMESERRDSFLRRLLFVNLLVMCLLAFKLS